MQQKRFCSFSEHGQEKEQCTVQLTAHMSKIVPNFFFSWRRFLQTSRKLNLHGNAMENNVVDGINLDILRQCREQIGLSVEDAERKFPRIKNFETGEAKPTYKQFDDLSDMYLIPQWVFFESELPHEYNLNSNAAFRKLSLTGQSDTYHTRKLLKKVEQLRELIIEIRNDLNDPISLFSPPSVDNIDNMAEVAEVVREWLGCSEFVVHEFDEWRKKIERKGIFVFLTSKMKSWSKVDISLFRGMAIYKEVLPIIIINDSDTYKAQIFTLFHELGHLIRKLIAIDTTDFDDNSEEEVWCNDFAGNFLMPYSRFKSISPPSTIPSEAVEEIKGKASKFDVSPLACLVRMRKLSLVDEVQYTEIKNRLYNDYLNENNSSFTESNILKETIRQYGYLYTGVIVDAYHSQEITLHRMCKLLDIKRPEIALELANGL